MPVLLIEVQQLLFGFLVIRVRPYHSEIDSPRLVLHRLCRWFLARAFADRGARYRRSVGLLKKDLGQRGAG
jgi:hypothetical protein